MPPAKYSDRKKFLLAHAIATIAGKHALAQEGIEFTEQWSSNLSSINFSVTEFTKILTREDIKIENEKKLYQVNIDKEGNQTINLPGLSYVGIDSVSKKVTRILKGINFPTESSIREVVTLFVIASFRKNILLGSIADSVDINIKINDEINKIIRYWSYLKQVNDQSIILTYPEFLNKNEILETDINKTPTTLQDILMYVEQSISYINQYITICESEKHKFVFNYFSLILKSIKKDAQLAYNNNEDLNIYKRRIRERSFEIEKELLRISLSTPNALEVYFSDSGFADTGEAVWTYDIPRKEILRELAQAKKINANIKLVRVLLLDSLDASLYSEKQLKILSLDIVTLLNHHVEVYVGSKKIAKQINEDLYNYAILTDGTVMRASEGHTEWRVAKVGIEHSQYKKLLNNYKSMLHESSNIDINFKPHTYLSMKKWKSLSEKECAEELIYPLLAEWLSGISDR